MAHPNINERRLAVDEMLLTGYSTKAAKEIANRFSTTLSSIYADVAYTRKQQGITVFPGKSAKLRVFARDKYICQYCEKPTLKPIADHVVPFIYGGPGVEYNLVTCCGSCNSKKKGKTVLPKNINVLKELNKEWAEHIFKAATVPALADQPSTAKKQNRSLSAYL